MWLMSWANYFCTLTCIIVNFVFIMNWLKLRWSFNDGFLYWKKYENCYTWSITSCIAWCTHAKMTVTPFNPNADATMSVQTPHLACSPICSPGDFRTLIPHIYIDHFLELSWPWPVYHDKSYSLTWFIYHYLHLKSLIIYRL